MRNCDTCGTEIPQERLDALPHTTTCVKCSRATKPKGFMISNFSKGTAPELVLVHPDGADGAEAMRLAQRANARRR